jgi:hypothetical protein
MQHIFNDCNAEQQAALPHRLTALAVTEEMELP